MNTPTDCTIIDGVKLLGQESTYRITLRDGLIDQLQAVAELQSGKNSQLPSNAQIIDAQGLVAVPGMIDLYTRLREPGLTRKGTIASQSTAALAAGFTKVLCAPDTLPTIDTVATVELVQHRAAMANGAHVLPMAALTIGLHGEQLSELATLQAAGCPVAGQADVPIQSTNVLNSAMEYAASFNMPLFMTPRDAQLGVDGCAHTGAMATRLGLPGIPVAAETVALARLLELCRETGCRLHISRLSSARAVQMIDIAKQQALPVTCDVGLHHLFFTDQNLEGYDSSFHSAVPFRSMADREALRAGLTQGVIDAICTDHAPHDRDASLAPFPATEAGLSAYQWAIPLILQLPDLLQLSLGQVMEKLRDAPGRVLDGANPPGIEQGIPADFFLLSPDHRIEEDSVNASREYSNHPLNENSAASMGISPLKGRVDAAFTQGRMHTFIDLQASGSSG